MKNRNIFQKIEFLRSGCNTKAISTCYDKSDGLPRDESRVDTENHQGDNLCKKRYGSR